MMSNSVLFEGSFYTSIMGHRTKVDFKIKNNYEVNATFQNSGSIQHEEVGKDWQ